MEHIAEYQEPKDGAVPRQASLRNLRASAPSVANTKIGRVRYAPGKSLWLGAMLLGALIGCPLYFSWAGMAVYVFSTGAVLLFGHSVGWHRKMIHNSFQCPAWLEYVLIYFGVQVGMAGPINLLRAHDLRDYAQRLPDCHDYLRHRNSFWRDAWLQLHCELELAAPPTITIEARIAANRYYRFLERTWQWQQLPPALLLYACGGIGLVCWGVCARIATAVIGHWLIGYFAHNHGEMHIEVRGAAVQGHNIRFTSLLTMGECWHNNHHAYPGSARLGLEPGEWDPGWWLLAGLQRIGLVWNIRLPQDLPVRPELRRLDGSGTGKGPAPTALPESFITITESTS
ncbi:MAG TPA: acyl-CoA desaturase [Burkholderiaceae bacterium]